MPLFFSTFVHELINNVNMPESYSYFKEEVKSWIIENTPVSHRILDVGPVFKSFKQKRAFILYANKAYLQTVQACVKSINTFSEIPVIVYLINCDEQIEGATAINWKCNVPDIPHQKDYIDRKDPAIYRMLIERPEIVKDALLNYAEEICYVDADSIATSYIDRIFDYFDAQSTFPYFVKGIYEYLIVDGKGGVASLNDLSTTLEAPICDLFSINQHVRKHYRQTGYFVAGQHCIDFLGEWSWMCNHPKVLQNSKWYAPFNEETVANALLWKYNIQIGLPLLYVNATLETINDVYTQYEYGKYIKEWVRMPNKKEELLFLHGEKNSNNMNKMIAYVKEEFVPLVKTLKVLFLAPHLSTGGMPAFLLKRIESLQQEDIEIYVVEWQCVSGDFVVQRNAIKKLVKNFYTLEKDKYELMKIIRDNRIDVVHIDEMIEHLANCPFDLKAQLYANDRTWRIVETCHNVVFKPDQEKRFNPDAYAFCTPYHLNVFKNMTSLKEVVEFPIDYKQVTLVEQADAQALLGMTPGIPHVLNVGLWTKGKNQGEGLKIAGRYPHMHFHFVGNRAGNFQEYWKPLMTHLPKNVTIWDERPDVDLFYKAADIFMFNSTFECSPLALREAISYNLPIVARDLPEYGNMFTPYLQSIDTDLNTIKVNYNVPTNNTTEDFGKAHLALYSEVVSAKVILTELPPNKVIITQHFVNNPHLEITGESTAEYLIKFFDEQSVCHYEHTTTANHWVQLTRSYFTKWTAKVWENGILIYDKTLDFTDQRVFISFESSSLGDSIAWIPYVLKFKEKHKCHVIVCTFKNFLFKSVYPELEFVEPGTTVHNLMAQYRIGWFDNANMQPELPNTISLQKCASNILGLDHEEVQPRISYKIGKLPTSKPYIAIATNSTAGCKFWQKEDWQEVINWLHDKGYDVINVSKEKNEFVHATQPFDESLSNTMNIIHHSKFLIGLSSGLSWLAWGMQKHTIMISNFTEKDHEYVSNCTRMVDESVCHGCWNNPNFKFDKGDWDWCPIHKGTSRQWECQKAITAKMVINEIQTLV